MLDATPELRGSIPLATSGEYAEPAPIRRFWGASGLAGVWAEANTRTAIYEAFRRKETFATSGPRIRLRFFGGFEFDNDLTDSMDGMSRAYAQGVAMGGELRAKNQDL